MLTLRFTEISVAEDKYKVQISLEGDGLSRQTFTPPFDFKLTAHQQEDLRWYLEDFLQNPIDPAPKIAARIERDMAELGKRLFGAVFDGDSDSRDLWTTLRKRLNDTRVEIITELRDAAAIPWELIRDPKTDTPLALRARAFVRAHPQPAQAPQLPQSCAGPIRILLVICRPGEADPVPFRSVASRLVKGLGEASREAFRLDVLRPPTFEQLGRVLRKARAGSNPYHVLHFDGHGAYGDQGLSPLLLSPPRPGAHGYLVFENPQVEENLQFVDGPALGQLMVETDVSVLDLNACRSAHAEAPNAPELTESDPHAQVRAFGSLALEVMDQGVAGVLAMRYNVYVVTAAQFVADLYAALSQGHSLGEAVTLGRKQLHDQPQRGVAYETRNLQDWPVPVIYEAAPIQLFPRPKKAKKITISLTGDAAPARGTLDPKLPPPPDAGFFGRDETLLALDRAFDTQSIVLLHAFAGSGKTATVAEFARWYALTGGVEGPVLFTSFEQYKPEQYRLLTRVLDEIERVFGKSLEQTGVHWLASDDAKRRDVALQVLKQIPVLWIWDNVEPVAGFPAGTPSAWSATEQQELADFLRAARETKAKFLLTSRRDEKAWLGDLPARCTLPPMPMLERVQLARALAEKRGRRLADVEDWTPLLKFTQGNPLTITVLVGQALRDGLRTREQIEAFVEKLRAGEAAFADEASEGRTKSLGASLSYGFEHAFSEGERRQLALLHLFQGFVDVDALCEMGNPKGDWCLPEVRDLTREAGIKLLDCAAEVGLLTAHGGGYYTIHPALPWFFRSLFEQFYAGSETQATRAFVEALGRLGNYYSNQYQDGNREVIGALAAEETNLLNARRLTRTHGWWESVIRTMQGLRVLYNYTGRRAEWQRLVKEIVPDFVDPATDGPLLGREKAWGFVTEYRVRLAGEARNWPEAERLQEVCVEWDRERAAPALAATVENLDADQSNAIRTLAVSLEGLGHLLRKRGNSGCVELYEQAIGLYQRIGDRAAEAVAAFNLGHPFLNVPGLRDLVQAEHWYRRSLELRTEGDSLGRAKCLGQLGKVAHELFNEARAAKQPKEELLRYLNAAARFYKEALNLTPVDAGDDLAVGHEALGNVYGDAGDLERAMTHYRQAIRYREAAGDLYSAAQARFSVAVFLARAGRFADALEYAKAALRNYEAFGERAAEEIQKTRELIAKIEQELKGS